MVDQIPEALRHVLTATEDTLSGAIRFIGTRVPVQALLDAQRAGESLAGFLEGYPDVTAIQAQAVLNWERDQTGALLGLDEAAG